MEFFFVSGFWARHPVEAGRDPFASYTRDLGNLRLEGFFFFFFFNIYIFVYNHLTLFFLIAVRRLSLSRFYLERIQRACLYADTSFHSLVTLHCLTTWRLRPKPSPKALAHEFTTHIILKFFISRMATMKENKGKEVVDEVTRPEA